MGRSPCCEKEGLNRGAWTPMEDEILTEYIKIHGEGQWRNLPKRAGLKRCGKSCRLRWLNYLRPDIKRGNITPDEEELIIRLHNLLGNRWSLIAGRLPGRTDNEIKNYWNTNLGKRVNQYSQHKTVTSTSTTTKKSQKEHKKGRGVSNEGTTRALPMEPMESNVVRTKAIRCTKTCTNEQQNTMMVLQQPSSTDESKANHSSPPCLNSTAELDIPSEFMGNNNNMGDFRMILELINNQEFSRVCNFSHEESSNSINDLSPHLVEHSFVLSQEMLEDWLGEKSTDLI